MGPKPKFLEHVGKRCEALRNELSAFVPPGMPLVLEIGCGHGHFLTRYATEFPGKICVGVDLRGERIERAQKKVRRAGLTNCRFIRAEAVEFLEALPAAMRFQEVWMLFPDPWPKKRHHKNRLLRPDFLERIANRSPAETRLYFRTDHSGYFQAAEVLAPTLRHWIPASEAAWPFEHETVFQSRAPSYRSLILVRTGYPSTAEETAARPQSVPAEPR